MLSSRLRITVNVRKWVTAQQRSLSSGNTSELGFRQLLDRESCTYTYLLADLVSKSAVIIDPVLELVARDSAIIKELEYDLKYAINTHAHADHVTGSLV